MSFRTDAFLKSLQTADQGVRKVRDKGEGVGDLLTAVDDVEIPSLPENGPQGLPEKAIGGHLGRKGRGVVGENFPAGEEEGGCSGVGGRENDIKIRTD